MPRAVEFVVQRREQFFAPVAFGSENALMPVGVRALLVWRSTRVADTPT
jgi:hypothetical protein